MTETPSFNAPPEGKRSTSLGKTLASPPGITVPESDTPREVDRLTTVVLGVLTAASLLDDENRDRVITSLAKYVNASTSPKRRTDEAALKEQLENGSKSLIEDASIKALTSSDSVLSDNAFLAGLIDESRIDNSLGSTAKDLLNNITEAYYYPIMRRQLYKPAALFWSIYQLERPEEGSPTPDLLVSFLKGHVDSRFTEERSEEEQKVLDHFRSEVFPTVYQDFAEIASFAPTVRHFKESNRAGEKGHLFFHQVEGIKILSEDECGILSDEPGTGKTLVLALTVLNMLDRKVKEKTGRVLVVGSNTVIDNWESELPLHVDTTGIEIANVNSITQRRDPSLRLKLRSLAHALSNPQENRQFILVNYDLFREPEFRDLLRQYKFDSIIVDEAHNVKSRFLESIGIETERNSSTGSTVAKRTEQLYSFILSNPEMSVFQATSTPFVKDLVEPLILAHLANRHLIPASKVLELINDPIGTYQAIKQVMLRRRKEDIADLPPKETILSPIDLELLSDDEKSEFISIAEEIIKGGENSFAIFYSLLALEGVAKYPWLVDKVKDIVAGGHKVVIFSPFVSGQDRYTSAVSTARIAEKLIQDGVARIGILDGTISDRERLDVQERFKRPVGDPEGLNVIVGNYLTAGESITLNSPENHATEVILFVAPNSLARYIQAIDRIHRIGQEEKVSIHIPYIVGDLLERGLGTYDERIVERLMKELNTFSAVVDGRFYIEEKDLFQRVVQSSTSEIKRSTQFKANYKGVSNTERVKRDRAVRRSYLSRLDTYSRRERRDTGFSNRDIKREIERKTHAADDLIEGKEFKVKRNITRKDIAPEDRSDIGIYLDQIHQLPRLEREDSDQEEIVLRFMTDGRSIDDLRKDEKFKSTIKKEDEDKFNTVLLSSKSIQEFLVSTNLGLVVSVAVNYQNRGMALLDLIQEGNFGLMKAAEEFNLDRDGKFYAYAIRRIRRSITLAMGDQVDQIKLPPHIVSGIRKVRRLTEQFQQDNERAPSEKELINLLVTKGNMKPELAEEVIDALLSGVSNVASLDKHLSEGTEASLIDFVASGEPTPEDVLIIKEDLLDQEVRQAVANAQSKSGSQETPDDYIPIDELGLNSRTRNALARGGITTIEQLGRATDEELLRLSTIGYKGVGEVRSRLKKVLGIDYFPRVDEPLTIQEIPIDALGLRDGTRNALARSGIRTIEQLREASDTDLLRLKGVGSKTVREAKEMLNKFLEAGGLEAYRSNPPLPKKQRKTSYPLARRSVVFEESKQQNALELNSPVAPVEVSPEEAPKIETQGQESVGTIRKFFRRIFGR